MVQKRIKQFQLDPSINIGGGGGGSPSITNIIAGTGLTGGGNSGPVTLNVIGGDGITATANDIDVDSTVLRTTGNQTIAGDKTFSDTIQADDGVQTNNGSASTPSYSFASDTNLGIYRAGTDALGISTAGIERFRVESDGTLSSQTANYENLVTSADDIPNKKYVDDEIAATIGSSPTENTFAGTSSITGLDITKRYLVAVMGLLPVGSTSGTATMGGVRIGTGTTPGGGTQIANTGVVAGGNWPDGTTWQSHTFVVSPNSTSINGAVNFGGLDGFEPANAMTAVEVGESVVTGDISLSNRSVLHNSGGPATSVTAQFLNSGTLQFVRSGASTITVAGEWYNLAPAVISNPGDYEIQISTNSGGSGVTGPALGAWHNLASSRSWSFPCDSFSICNWNFTASIRDVATQTIQDTATIIINIETGV